MQVNLTGAWLTRTILLYVGQAQAAFTTSGPYPAAEMDTARNDNSVLTFTVPASNITGYIPLTLTYQPFPLDASSAAPPPTNWTGLDWLFATAVSCPDGWLVDGYECDACPSGGYCPGGGRVWPLPGYWSWNEVAAPTACALPLACPGALSQSQLAADGARQTSNCAEGFTGPLCASCAAGYYQVSQRCLSCGLQSTDRDELGVLLTVALALFVSMAVCVATLSPTALSSAVSSLLFVQHLSVIGKLGASQVPSDMTWLSQVFGVLSLLNWEPGFIKAGCVTPELSFLSVYAATLGMVVLTSGMFTAASLLRAVAPWRRWQRKAGGHHAEPVQPPLSPLSSHSVRKSDAGDARRSSGEGPAEKPWQWRFRARLTHSHLILGSILYLRLTTLNLQALNCTDVQLSEGGDLQSVLSIDLSTRCYEGAHLAAAIVVVWPSLFLFSIGFPLLSAALLWRSFHGAAKRTLSSAISTEGKAVELASMERSVGSRQMLRSSTASSSGWTSPVAVSAPCSPMGAGPRRAVAVQALLVYKAAEPSSALISGSRLSRTHERARQLSRDEEKEQVEVEEDVQWDERNEQSQSSPPGTGRCSTESATTASDPEPALHRRGPSLSRPPRLPTLSIRARPTVAPLSPSTEPAVKMPALEEVAEDRLSATKREAGVDKQPTQPPLLRPLSSTKVALRLLVKDERRQEWFGFLYRQLKGELYYFRLLLLATSFGFACVSVLPTSATERLFLTGVAFLLDTAIITAATPFETDRRNFLSVCTSCIGVVQCMIMLALVQLQLSAGSDDGVDVGHSTQSQGVSASPSDELLGVSDAAAQFELILGSLCIATAVGLSLLHWRSIVDSLREKLCHTGEVLRQRLRRWRSADGGVEAVDPLQCRRDSSVQPPPMPRNRGGIVEMAPVRLGDADSSMLSSFN